METKEMYMKVHVKGGSEVEFIAFSGAVVQQEVLISFTVYDPYRTFENNAKLLTRHKLAHAIPSDNIITLV